MQNCYEECLRVSGRQGDSVLNVQNVSKRFVSIAAVNNFSFDASDPQIIGIISRSGAGKSTFLRVMNCMTEATEGEITVDGTNVLALKGRAKMDWQCNCAMIL